MQEQFIKWNDIYNTGNFVIDYQHRRLVQLINDLEEVIQQKELKPTLLTVIFDEVASYTQYHFQTEEELMDNVNYSGIGEHKKLHSDFIKDLTGYKIEFDKGVAYIDISLCQFLKDWLLVHIAVEDRKVVAEMGAGQGVV